MSVHVTIVIHKDVVDLDKAVDFADEVKELLDGKVEATMSVASSNHNPPYELTKEN